MYSTDYYESLMIIYFVAFIIVGLIVGFICGKVSESIAAQKGYDNTGTYFWLGFFLGVIGVVIAACLSDKNSQAILERKGSAEELMKMKKLLDSGVLTPEEFEKKKKEILSR